MKTIVALFCLCIVITSFSYAQKHPLLKDIDALAWENRIILVWSDKPDQERETLTQSNYEIDDRDIVWFVISDGQMLSNYQGELSDNLVKSLNSHYQSEDHSVVLIGKDGGVKDRSNRLDLNDLFQQIDAMPMRIIEMGL